MQAFLKGLYIYYIFYFVLFLLIFRAKTDNLRILSAKNILTRYAIYTLALICPNLFDANNIN